MVLPCSYCKEGSFALELHHKCNSKSYVCVIGMVKDDFDIREIKALQADEPHHHHCGIK
jgi:hypothetical protein